MKKEKRKSIYWLMGGVAALIFLGSGSLAAAQVVTSYNDLAWTSGQLDTNITTITSPAGGSGLLSSGQLVDFSTGNPTAVTLTVTGGLFDGPPSATQGADPTTGDAFTIFGGKVNGLGVLSYVNGMSEVLVLTFTNMDPTKVYDLTFFAHRNANAWDRASLVTLSGQDAFVNTSSIASDNPDTGSFPGGVLFTGPTSPITRLPSDNDSGYVARFSKIKSGSDGQVVLTISFDGSVGEQYKGKYGSAIQLIEAEETPGVTSYNDLAWATGQRNTNITTITSPTGGSGLLSSGQLIDFENGTATAVTLTVTGGLFDGPPSAAQGADPTTGDAFDIFDGKVNGLGVLSYVNGMSEVLVLTFTNMRPGNAYDLTFFAHRNANAWDRASLVTISGQDAFVNTSSAATDNPSEGGGVIFTGPTDTSTRLPSDNDNGYVARFSNIKSGSDGQVVLTISFDGSVGEQYKGKYGSAIRLIESGNTANDLDGDGKADIVVRNMTSGDVGAWLGNGLTLGMTGILTSGLAAEWIIAGNGDIDGDGKADILVRNTSTGDVGAWLGNGLTLGMTGILTSGLAAEWVIQGLGDLDGDGKADILVRNTSTGDVGAWLGNGLTLGMTGILTSGLAADWVIKGLGDLDGDGKDDIVLRNTTSGDVGVWLGNGLTLGMTGILTSGLAAEWVIAGLGDLDGDGKDDIVVRNTSTGSVGAWLGNGLTLGMTGVIAAAVPLEWTIQP